MKDEMWIDAIGGAHCSDCRFFEDAGKETANDSIGICRRQAPRTNEYGVVKWPIVKAGDWCGEFELSPSARRAFEAEWLERWNGRLK